jgi:hypothetical protein
MMNNTGNIWTFLSKNLVSLITIISGCVVLIIPQLGLITGTHIYTATLALLILLATSEVIDKSRKLDTIESRIADGFEKIIHEAGYPHITKFPTPEEGFRYLTNRIKECRTNIEHASLAPSPPRWFTDRQEFSKARINMLKESKIRYRYILWGSKDQLGIKGSTSKTLEHVTEWLNDQDIKRCFVSYLEKLDYDVPGISFMIFDNSDLAVYLPSVSGEAEVLIAIKHPIIVEAFTNYFRRLWEDATRLDKKTESLPNNQINLTENREA